METALAVFLAFILDAIFGDPYKLPHPVRFIGNLIHFLEKILRKVFSGKSGEIFGGAILMLLTVSISFIMPFAILYLLRSVNAYAAFALEVFWCYQIFAAKSLKKESMRVYNCIKENDLKSSRKYLSWIVGRDTENLDFRQITKAVVETVAENTSDGVIAPMIFMIIGGAPLGFLYKAVNTLDSMVGYKNEKYINFGKVSALTDDVFNFFPARITGILFAVSSFFLGFDGKNAFKIFKRDRFNHASPNSAQCESACAGALNIQLAGDAYYFGELYKKKTIGDDIRPIEADDIKKSIRLMYGASVLCLCICLAVRILVTFI